MRRLLVGLVAASVAAMLSVTGVSASSGATVTHFTATYPSLLGEIFTCSGSHIVKTAPKAFVKDSESCIVSGNVGTYYAGTFTSGIACPPEYGLPPGNECGSFPPVAGVPGIIDGIVYWFSDFNLAVATSWTMTITRNPDGTFTDDTVAYYPS